MASQEGFTMKKILLVFLLLFSFLYAQEDANKSLSPEEKMIYAPDIIAKGNQKSGFYAGLGLAQGLLHFDSSLMENKNYMLDLAVISGYNINEYLDAEGRVLLSIGYDNGVDYHSWGLFLKPKYEIYKNIDLYSLIGYGSFKAVGIDDKRINMKHSGVQVGIGANYKLKDNFKIFADYIYMGKDGSALYKANRGSTKSSALTAGISYDF